MSPSLLAASIMRCSGRLLCLVTLFDRRDPRNVPHVVAPDSERVFFAHLRRHASALFVVTADDALRAESLQRRGGTLHHVRFEMPLARGRLRVEKDHVVIALVLRSTTGPLPVVPDDLVTVVRLSELSVEQELEVVAGGRVTVEEDRPRWL